MRLIDADAVAQKVLKSKEQTADRMIPVGAVLKIIKDSPGRHEHPDIIAKVNQLMRDFDDWQWHYKHREMDTEFHRGKIEMLEAVIREMRRIVG